jgi:hypothetical protein
MVAGVPVGAFRGAAIEMQVLAQLLCPLAIEPLTDASHSRAQNLQFVAEIGHCEFPVAYERGRLLPSNVATVANNRGKIANEAHCILSIGEIAI